MSRPTTGETGTRDQEEMPGTELTHLKTWRMLVKMTATFTTVKLMTRLRVVAKETDQMMLHNKTTAAMLTTSRICNSYLEIAQRPRGR